MPSIDDHAHVSALRHIHGPTQYRRASRADGQLTPETERMLKEYWDMAVSVTSDEPAGIPQRTPFRFQYLLFFRELLHSSNYVRVSPEHIECLVRAGAASSGRLTSAQLLSQSLIAGLASIRMPLSASSPSGQVVVPVSGTVGQSSWVAGLCQANGKRGDGGPARRPVPAMASCAVSATANTRRLRHT